jgi:RHS repeat-associated protein
VQHSNATAHLGARDYEAWSGLWLQADTIIPDPRNPQSLNRYAYVLGNPMKLVDPSGRCGVFPGVDDGDCFAGTDPLLFEPMANFLNDWAERNDTLWDRNYPQWPPPDGAQHYYDLTLSLGTRTAGVQWGSGGPKLEFGLTASASLLPLDVSLMGAQGSTSKSGAYVAVQAGAFLGGQTYAEITWEQAGSVVEQMLAVRSVQDLLQIRLPDFNPQAQVGVTTPQASASLYYVFDPCLWCSR